MPVELGETPRRHTMAAAAPTDQDTGRRCLHRSPKEWGEWFMGPTEHRAKNWWGAADVPGEWYDPQRMREYPSAEGTRSHGEPKMETTFANMSISPPPKIDLRNYESSRNELLRWRDMHGSGDDRVPIAHLDVQCPEGALKSAIC